MKKTTTVYQTQKSVTLVKVKQEEKPTRVRTHLQKDSFQPRGGYRVF